MRKRKRKSEKLRYHKLDTLSEWVIEDSRKNKLAEASSINEAKAKAKRILNSSKRDAVWIKREKYLYKVKKI